MAIAPRPSLAIRVAKWLALFAIGTVVLVVGFYFVISLCIAWFKLSGSLVEGAPMFFDLHTPRWGPLLAAQAACVAILGTGLFLRRKLLGKPAGLPPQRLAGAARTLFNVAVTLAIFGALGYLAYALGKY